METDGDMFAKMPDTVERRTARRILAAAEIILRMHFDPAWAVSPLHREQAIVKMLCFQADSGAVRRRAVHI